MLRDWSLRATATTDLDAVEPDWGALRRPPITRPGYTLARMARPARFEHQRYVGDKRTLVVYDLEHYDTDPDVTAAVDDLSAAETFLAFGPDTLAEARNRGYRPHRSIRAHEPA